MSTVEIIIRTIDKSNGDINKLTSNLGQLAARYVSVGAVAGVAYKVLKDSISDTLAYADSVRKLSTISGQSTEETSRFIQVLDDYKISADDALVATRALTKEGHAPSIETLAELSDQYLKLSTAEERNEFVLKNLGRGGLQWVEVLQKGKQAILEQGDAVSKNLILTQKMVDDARRAEVAMDNWGDSMNELKTILATNLLPALTDAADGALWLTKVSIMYFDAIREGKLSEFDFGEALKQAREEIQGTEDSMLSNADAAGDMAKSVDGLTDSEKANEEAAKRLSDIYDGLLSSMFAINDENENYQQSLDDMAQRDADLAAEKNKLTLQMWEEQRAGKLTNDEYLRYVENLDSITKAQEENTKAIQQAGEDHEKASKQRVYDLVQQRLAADGITSSGEYEYLQDLAVQQGLVSRAAADQAIKESQLADTMVNSFAKTQPAMEQSLATMQAIAAYNGTVVNFGVNFSQSGSAGSGYGGGGYHPLTTSGPGSKGGGTKVRDSGGAGVAGTPYMIGTGAQPEVFVPDTDGTFTPNANKLGATYNITINNPKVEKSENSIRSALKRLSYVGIAS